MRKMIGIFTMALWIAYSPTAFALEDEFQIVIHPTNEISVIDQKVLTDIFFKKKTYWPDGSQIVVIDLAPTSNVRMHFSEKVLGRPVSAVRNYWQQLLFSGRGVPPAEFKNDREVLDFIASHEEAVGYVSSGADIGNLKRLKIK